MADETFVKALILPSFFVNGLGIFLTLVFLLWPPVGVPSNSRVSIRSVDFVSLSSYHIRLPYKFGVSGELSTIS